MKNSTILTAPALLCSLACAISDIRTSLRRIVSMLLIIACITTLIVVSSPMVLEAQTEWKDNYLTLAEEDQTNPAIAEPAQSAYTIVVWEDNRDPSTYHTDIYAQRIDNKNGLPQWDPPDGVPVCTAGGNQSNPRAAYDSLGNVIIVWEDYRDDSTYASIYGNCLSVTTGGVHRSWDDDGDPICDKDEHAERPRVAGAGDGVFVSWVDWRNSPSTSLDSAYRDIYLQYMVSNTASYPSGGGYSWVLDGVLVPNINIHDDRNVELARDFYWAQAADTKDRDGVMLVYESKRDTSEVTSDSVYFVYADRFDADGVRTWGDVRCATNNEEQVYPQLEVLGRYNGVGDSVAVIAWQDMRPDADPPVVYDIYGQHLSKYTGQVLGTAAGDAICDHASTQRYPVLSLYERQENLPLSVTYLARVICVWEDLRNTGSQGIDVYAAVLNGVTGVLLNTSGLTGEEICTNAGDQTQVRVDNLGLDEDSYIVWRDGDVGGTDIGDIWYQGMDLLTLNYHETAGSGLAVTEAKGDQSNPQVGGKVFAWADKRREGIQYDTQNDWNIYAETPGECVGPKDMNWRDMFADVNQVGDAAAMRFAVDDEYNTFVVWEEPGEESGDQDVYIQKLDKTGVPRWPNSGIKLNTNSFSSHPDVCISDSTGGAQVAWHEEDDGGDGEIWYAKLSPLGAFTALVGVEVDKDTWSPFIEYTQKHPVDTSGGLNYPAYVAFLYKDNGGNTELGLYSDDGGSFDVAAVMGDFDFQLVDLRMAVSSHGEVYLVGWEDAVLPHIAFAWTYPHPTGYISATHSIEFNEIGGADIAADFEGGGWNHDGYVVYCADEMGGADEMDLYAIHLPATTANFLISSALTSATEDERATQPTIVPDSSFNASGYGGLLVAWDWEYDIPTTAQHKVQTNKLEYVSSGGGSLAWSNSTIIDASEPLSDFSYPDIARISNQSAADTMGFIVFEGVSEACTPSRTDEVLGQFVFYNTYGQYPRGSQWKSGIYPQGKQVGPGGGYYTQTLPMVKTSENNTVNVFWIDGRGSTDLVMGTRTWGDTARMYWLKESFEPPALPIPEVVFGALYPNPVTLSRSRVSNVVIDASSACTVSLKLYDNLGRVVSVVHDGELAIGYHTLQIDVAALPPGMYYYVLRSSETVTSRGLVIVR